MKNILKLIVLLFALNIGAQVSPNAPIQHLDGAKFTNATEVTTALKIPVLDANLKLNTWISPTAFSSGLEAIDEGNGIGWRLIGRDPLDFGNIGFDAIDLGSASGGVVDAGATGIASFNSGSDGVASANSSWNSGSDGTASGIGSLNSGDNGIASGEDSWNSAVFGTASGYRSFNSAAYGTSFSYGENNIGVFSTEYTPLDVLTFNGADRLFNIGNGTAIAIRSNAVTVLKNGKTGIGYDQFETTTDSELLQINGEVKATNFVGNLNGFSDQIRGTGAVNYLAKFTAAGTVGDSQIFDNGTNVGVGIASPTSKLHVNGTAEIEGSLTVDDALTLSDTGSFAQIAGSKPMRITGQSVELNSGVIKFLAGRVEVGGITAPSGEQLAVNGSTFFGGSAKITGSLIVNADLQDNSGNSGTAGQVLSSTGNGVDWVNASGGISGSTNYLAKFTGSGNIGDSEIYDNGSIGIGTTNPTSKLHVKATVGAVSVFEGQNGSTTMVGHIIEMSGSTANSLRATTVGGSLDFIVDGNLNSEPSLTIAASGNVGIGTAIPEAALDVSSTTQGFLPPRMTEVQMNAIVTPVAGLILYCTDCSPATIYLYDGTSFAALGAEPAPILPLLSIITEAQYNALASANTVEGSTDAEFSGVTGAALTGNYGITGVGSDFSLVSSKSVLALKFRAANQNIASSVVITLSSASTGIIDYVSASLAYTTTSAVRPHVYLQLTDFTNNTGGARQLSIYNLSSGYGYNASLPQMRYGVGTGVIGDDAMFGFVVGIPYQFVTD